ncbi:hypothetical protein SRHO_G00203430 [Serrasalmus rhombeus]
MWGPLSCPASPPKYGSMGPA